MIEKYKHTEVNLGNLIKRICDDAVYRSRWSLTFSMIWSILMFGYYLALAIVDTISGETIVWSWYYNLSFWYFIFVVFKIIYCINLFKRLNNQKYIDFKLLSIIFLFINFAESLFIALTPVFFANAFQNKLNRSLKIITIVINCVNVALFILTFIPVNKDKYTRNETEFLRSRKYVSRMGGIFNILIITINMLLFFDVQKTHPRAVAFTYLAISLAFAIMSLVLAILQIKKRNKELKHK